MLNVLHINCNYLDNAVHKLLVQHLEKFEIYNKVYVPIGRKNIYVSEENVVVSNCFKIVDRVWFDFKQNKIFRDITKKIDLKKFNIIHAYTLFTDGNCAFRIYKKYKIPYVVAVRNTDMNYFLKYRIWLRKRGINIIKNSKAVFFLSNSYMERFLELYVPEDLKSEIKQKCIVIPNGVDKFWIENKIREAKIYRYGSIIKILYVGKIDKEKNLKLTLEAINKLSDEGYGIQYTAVGKIINKSVYNLLEKNNHVKYISHCSKEELINIYRENDLFVMPSLRETFGVVYVEAMSQGLPVVYTRNEGFDGQFSDGIVGYAIDSHSSDELVYVIKNILEKYHDISERCLKNVEIFDWDDIAKKYEDIYQEVLST